MSPVNLTLYQQNFPCL